MAFSEEAILEQELTLSILLLEVPELTDKQWVPPADHNYILQYLTALFGDGGCWGWGWGKIKLETEAYFWRTWSWRWSKWITFWMFKAPIITLNILTLKKFLNSSHFLVILPSPALPLSCSGRKGHWSLMFYLKSNAIKRAVVSTNLKLMTFFTFPSWSTITAVYFVVERESQRGSFLLLCSNSRRKN